MGDDQFDVQHSETYRGVQVSHALDAAFCAAARAEGVSPSAALRRSMEVYVAAVAQPRSRERSGGPLGLVSEDAEATWRGDQMTELPPAA